ncbi:conserved hypothetical protein, partial [Ricinus communis]
RGYPSPFSRVKSQAKTSLPQPPVIRPRTDRIRAATVRADSSTTDSTLTFEVEAEGIEDYEHSPFASPKNEEKEDSQKRKAKGGNGLLRVLP